MTPTGTALAVWQVYGRWMPQLAAAYWLVPDGFRFGQQQFVLAPAGLKP